jgi:hypothetical protein
MGPDEPDPQRRSDMTKNTDMKKVLSGADATKSTMVATLLTRTEGATLDDLTEATGWQPHSCRAYLTGLRKKGWAITRSKREDGVTVWHGTLADTAARTGKV